MRHRLLPALLLGLLVLTGHGLTSENPAAAQGDPASEIFQLVNQVRMTQGLPPFQWNGQLAAAAQNHANWMAQTSIFSHTGAGGSTPLSRAQAAGYQGSVSENIVGGTNMSPRQGILWWQNSATHYATIVSARYVEAGTGYANGGSQNMYVLVVGRPSGAAPLPLGSQAESRAAPLIITPITLAEPREDGAIVHVVRQGQAMWTIAAYYDVDLDHLYLINNLTEKDFLHPGDEVFVRLPDGVAPPPTPTPPLTHTVREGENAWSISARNNIDISSLYLLNGLNEESVLQPGDVLKVRLAEGESPPPTPTPRTTHTVRAGESAWSIAVAYGLSVEQLLNFNGLTGASILQPGDELIIREQAPEPTPTEPPPTGTPFVEAPEPAVSATASPGPQSLAMAANAPVPLRATSSDQVSGQESSGPSWALFVAIGLLALAGGVFYLAYRQQG
jgi:uncharacterized protein YkwD/LysM repeat protein